MSTSRTFKIIVAEWQTQLAQVDTFTSATLVARHNAVSAYELVMPADTEAARAILTAARPRILFVTEDGVLRSGPVIRLHRSFAADADVLTVNGVDDLAWLARRLAHPEPGVSAPPYNHQAYHTISGAASQVIADFVSWNAGPKAILNRQVPGLQVPVPVALGPQVKLSARYQNLLDFVTPTAKAAGLGFRVRDLIFETFVPSGSARFSVELGTLASWESAMDAPDVTYVYVAGQGEGMARTIRELYDQPALMAWGRFETFQDRRDTADAAELDQAGRETLADSLHPPSIVLSTLDTQAQEFGRDWNVGDTAYYKLADGTPVRDVIVEAKIELQPNRPPIITPVMGEPPLTLSAWRAIQGTDARVRQLERV